MRILKSTVSSKLTALVFSMSMAGVLQAEPITIGTVSWAGFSGFYVADGIDAYAPYNTEVRLVQFPDNTTMLTKFDAGEVDMALVTYEKVVEEVAKGNPMKVLMVVDYSNGGDSIVASRDIAGIADLKGRAVGVEYLSPGALLLDYALMQNNLSAQDIKAENMAPDAVSAGLERGSIVAGVTYEPYTSPLLSAAAGAKFHLIYSSKDAPGLITDVMVAKDSYIQAHGEDIKGIIRGYRDALAYLHKEPEKSVRFISPEVGASGNEVKAQLKEVQIPDLQEMLSAFKKSDDIKSFHASGEVIGKVLKGRGKITATPAIEQTFDDSFVKAVLAD